MTTTSLEQSKPSVVSIFARFRELVLIAFIVLLMVLISLRNPNFLTFTNFRDILMDISILAMIALAQGMIIITRGIDLSVASMLGLTAMMVSFVIKAYPETPPIVAVVLGMALGAVLGSVNGLIITIGRVPPIIATLGTLSIYRGLIFLYSNGTWINAYEMSPAFKQLAKGTPLGLPNLVITALFVAVMVFAFLNYLQPGRDIYALGTNPDAAAISGIRTQRTKFIVYVISGIVCGLAGVMWASRFEAAQTNTALGFELQTVAAAVIGGVSMMGGIGTVPGILLGALLLGVIQNGLALSGISPFWELAVQGFLILLAVVVDSTIQQRIKRTMLRSSDLRSSERRGVVK
ncbi:MAG TPA: ABC transporter permease [Anaerolineae bacterium]|nr:ABC transporter permease [Anaerolineae bacterium]